MRIGKRNETGAALVEYGILVALLLVACSIAIADIGDATSDVLCRCTGYLQGQQRILSYNRDEQCCGYDSSNFGGSFTCVR